MKDVPGAWGLTYAPGRHTPTRFQRDGWWPCRGVPGRSLVTGTPRHHRVRGRRKSACFGSRTHGVRSRGTRRVSLALVSGQHREGYMKQYQRQWIAARRKAWIEGQGPCILCGSTAELEIDHIDRSQKSAHVSTLWSLSPTNPKRIAELAKCQVLCRSCHSRKTAKDLKYLSAPHGTSTRYQLGCRCKACKDKVADQKRAWRERTGKK